MFNFTTTNVINVDKDLTSGKALWTAVEEDSTTNTPAYFKVLRVGNFYADNITSVYKAEPNDPELAKICIDFSTLEESATEGDIFSLNVYVALTQASQDSRYANDFYFKGKPFSIEFVWLGNAEDTLAKLLKDMKHLQFAIYNGKQLNATVDGTLLTIEATTEYQRFKVVSIDKFDKYAYHGMGEYTPVLTLANFEEVDDPDSVGANKWFKGKEGFGTFAYILHNLRIPTIKRTRAFAPNQDESPVPGAKYVQYTIHYCAKRGELGMNAVGDLVKSATTHVFYVKEDLADLFENGGTTSTGEKVKGLSDVTSTANIEIETVPATAE